MKRLRPHLSLFIIILLLAIVLTFPTIIFVIHPDLQGLPHNNDSSLQLWPAWHIGQVLFGEHTIGYVNDIFYPEGVSTTFHSYNMLHAVLTYILHSVLSWTQAFNLMTLLNIGVTVGFAYVYFLHLIRHRALSLLGACLFGLSLHILLRPQHPELTMLFVIPAMMLILDKLLMTHRVYLALLGGVVLGMSVYIGLYIFVCLLITVGLWVLWHLTIEGHWRQRVVWRNLVLLGLMSILIAGIRLMPMMTNHSSLKEALAKTLHEEPTIVEDDNDLLLSFVNVSNPFVGQRQSELWGYTQGLERTYYLTYIGMTLIVIGFIGKSHRRRMLPWFIIFSVFFVLRLGSFLTINGVPNLGMPLPKYYLNQLIPSMFKSFHVSGHFQIGMLLPFAVLTVYGAMTLFRRIPTRHHSALILVVLALILMENYVVVGTRQIEPAETLFYEQLAQGDHEQGALIQLPMGRQQSKSYLYYQTIHALPIVEGLIARTPDEAYHYIDSQPALSAWRQGDLFTCEAVGIESYQQAINDLINDGFVYVMVHHQLDGAQVSALNFMDVTPYWHNDFMSVYRLQDLQRRCGG